MPATIRQAWRTVRATLACLPLLLAGCDWAAQDATHPAVASPTAAATHPPLATDTAASESIPEVVLAAMQAAARDAGVPLTQVSLLAYSREDWPSSALGCPQPDQSYAQVITPGYRVRLLVAGVEAEYHTDLGAAVVRCAP
jgi:hypothetical protein